ncbi:MAG: toll/interleukin-1 receptor domain-containing protein [Vicinamibacterales bacterium]
MTPWRVAAAVAVAGTAVALLMPVSPALDPSEALRARLVSAAGVAALCAGLAFVKGGSRALWTGLAAACAAGGAALVVGQIRATGPCVAVYDGRPTLVGRAYTPAAADYVREHPGLGARDLLLDAGGVADRIWTPASIASCRFWVGWAGLFGVPLLATAVAAAAAARGLRLGPASSPSARPPAAATPAAPVYDAFLSYRHVEPDRAYAEELVRALEARGFRAAIDVRDFAPNRHFLAEMERCIRESRFTLCVVTARYLESDHTGEEAVIAKTLDLAERTRRVVPLVYERVELPVWLHGLVGIDFSQAARVDPQERLLALLQGEPAG